MLAGVQWTGSASARIELRVRVRAQAWSRWGLASSLGHGPDGPPVPRALIGQPVWTGPADALQVRSSQPVHDLQLHFVDVPEPGGARAHASAGLPLAQPSLHAGSGQPPIIARSAWGGPQAPPTDAPEYGRVALAFVHHTDSLNGYGADQVPAMLLAMYDFHTYTLGWEDIGYNFVIDLYGRIWEARAGGIDQPVVGAQAGGYNQESTGVALLGTFATAVPTAPAIGALERLLAWKLSLHGVPALGNVTVEVNPADFFYTPFRPGQRISLPRVAGHRQGDSTDCPGDALYALLPGIRLRVAALASSAARITLHAPARARTAATPFPVSGRLARLGGRPLAGAAVEVQAVHSRLGHPSVAALATATTAADGRWSASVTLRHNALLRALHRSVPATVSVLTALHVAPAITLELDALVPLAVSGTIDPTKPRATIELYALRSGRRVLIGTKLVRATGGSFAAHLGYRAPGKYQVVAHTAADAVNAAGRSPLLAVSV